jgi:hypothetical protein
MPPSKVTYDLPSGSAPSILRENGIEYGFIGTLQGLKYDYRPDITDRAALERDFREKFESLNRVRLTDSEFAHQFVFNADTRVVPIEEIRAKEGKLSIPLYVGGETQAQTDATSESAPTALPDALVGWLKSSENLKATLVHLYQPQ